ncbi:hypothetical protein E2320_001789 [Naja naja]|nr:hypothetical protein E2320_001789 [Naja naja]
MNPECSGEKSTNRSASPHRNTYRIQFQALRKNFDEKQGAVGETLQQTRGRQYGSNVNRIKNLFMQMGSKPSENAEGTTRVRGRSSLSSEEQKKPIVIVEKADGSVVQLEASVSERISRFDAVHDESSKFTEIRKEFKRNETQPSKYSSPQKEKTVSVDEQQAELCISQSSKETAQEAAMGSSSSETEAVFPTVTGSAVFENIDSQKDVVVSEKESSEEFTVTGHYPLNLSAVNKDLSPTVGSLDSFSPLKETSAWPLSTQNTSSVSLENSLQTPTLVNEKSKSTLPVLKTSETQIKSAASGPSEALEQEMVVDSCDEQDMGETKAETESNASSLQQMVLEGAQNLEMPGNPVLMDDSAFYVASFSAEDRSEREMQEEQEDCQSSHGSGHTDNNAHKIESIYNFDWESGGEEDFQEDSDSNSMFIIYGKHYFEINGLSDDEKISPTRKIKFSTAPIKLGFRFARLLLKF